MNGKKQAHKICFSLKNSKFNIFLDFIASKAVKSLFLFNNLFLYPPSKTYNMMGFPIIYLHTHTLHT